MGEIADMMLDGTLCPACGEYIGEGEGFPQYCCKACEPETPAPSRGDTPWRCRHGCTKRFGSEQALRAHHRDKHADYGT